MKRAKKLPQRANGAARPVVTKSGRQPTGAEIAQIVAVLGTSEKTVRAVLMHGHATRSSVLAQAIRGEWERIQRGRGVRA
jgi:hypothetical protein